MFDRLTTLDCMSAICFSLDAVDAAESLDVVDGYRRAVFFRASEILDSLLSIGYSPSEGAASPKQEDMLSLAGAVVHLACKMEGGLLVRDIDNDGPAARAATYVVERDVLKSLGYRVPLMDPWQAFLRDEFSVGSAWTCVTGAVEVLASSAFREVSGMFGEMAIYFCVGSVRESPRETWRAVLRLSLAVLDAEAKAGIDFVPKCMLGALVRDGGSSLCQVTVAIVVAMFGRRDGSVVALWNRHDSTCMRLCTPCTLFLEKK